MVFYTSLEFIIHMHKLTYSIIRQCFQIHKISSFNQLSLCYCVTVIIILVAVFICIYIFFYFIGSIIYEQRTIKKVSWTLSIFVSSWLVIVVSYVYAKLVFLSISELDYAAWVCS